ncbi:hypothetical protein GCM10009535_17630 [Streptomyces thermocarboxydovorans]|uniref:Uncharacterized protein n=1 Tax=Streptomyces thermocarboxydovorans TaxID=59298 RepID=A0ABN1HE53_9ACTN
MFRLSGEWPRLNREEVLLADLVEAVQYVEWEHFATEYPQLAERGREFPDRLVRAVTPVFPSR